MIRWLIFLVSPIALFAFSTTEWDFASGPRVGIYGSFSTIHFQMKGKAVNGSSGAQEYFNVPSVQAAEGGGLFLGYVRPLFCRVGLGGQLDFAWNANKAMYGFMADASTATSVIFAARNRYLLEGSLQPQWQFSSCVLGYFKVGLVWADIRLSETVRDNDVPFTLLTQGDQSKLSFGYSLGCGLRVKLMRRISAIVEYDWRQTRTHFPAVRLPIPSGASGDEARVGITDMVMTSFVFGLMTSF